MGSREPIGTLKRGHENYQVSVSEIIPHEEQRDAGGRWGDQAVRISDTRGRGSGSGQVREEHSCG